MAAMPERCWAMAGCMLVFPIRRCAWSLIVRRARRACANTLPGFHSALCRFLLQPCRCLCDGHLRQRVDLRVRGLPMLPGRDPSLTGSRRCSLITRKKARPDPHSCVVNQTDDLTSIKRFPHLLNGLG